MVNSRKEKRLKQSFNKKRKNLIKGIVKKTTKLVYFNKKSSFYAYN
jgi:hypothetical protein